MPDRHSIFFKLNLLFLLALITLGLLFALFRVTATRMEMRREAMRGMELERLLHHTRTLGNTERSAEFRAAQFTLLPSEALPENAQSVKPRKAPPGPARFKPPLKLYQANGVYYFKARPSHKGTLIRDERPAERFVWMQLLFALLLTGLITLYVLLRRSLRPLRTLHRQIRRFTAGELDIDTSSPRRDEIAAIANEFNDALTQLRTLQASRRLFLRNIMHELKTPLTKGKLALAMMETGEQTAYLDRLFNRMDELINRIAGIEKLQSIGLEKAPHRLEELLQRALEQLYLDPMRRESLQIAVDSQIHLDVDATLFVSALANLLDNALQYAKTPPINVIADRKQLCISNGGEPLAMPIDTLIRPFGGTGNSEGLSLGLSISDTVIRAHGFELRYEYKEGIHRFCIRFAP